MRILFCLATCLLLLQACTKKMETVQKEVQTKFPVPSWTVDHEENYSASMAAVIQLPAALASSVATGDQLAAFIGGECRGTADLIKVDNSSLFFVLVRGLPEETGSIVFKYYSAKTSFMYQSTETVNFMIDAVYGTAAKPKTLDLKQLK